jgi:hypothetical protein
MGVMVDWDNYCCYKGNAKGTNVKNQEFYIR